MALDEQPNDNQKNFSGHGNRFLDTQKQVSPTSTYFDDAASLNSKTLLPHSQGTMPPTSAPTTPTECHRVPTSMTNETDLVSLTSSSMNGTVLGGSAGTTSEYPDVSSSPNNENDEKLAAFRNCSSSETPNSATTLGETTEMDTEAASTEGAMSQCKAVPTSSAISPNQNMKEASVLSTCHKNMNQKCKVCGEPAAGFHFGAFTCEGCKSFFGRTYKNLTSLNDCKNNGRCTINKKTRTACKSCRLRRCLMVGMSKSGSRYGRRSNWFKMHYLMQNNDKTDDDKNNNTTSIGYDDKTLEVTSASNVIKHLPRDSSSLKPNLATSSNLIFGEPSVIESSMQQVQQNKKHLWFYVLPSEFQGKNFTNVFLDNYKNTTVQEKIKPQCDQPRAPFFKTNIPSTTISSQQILPSSICSHTPTTPRVQELPATDFSFQSNKTPVLSLTEQNRIEEHIKSSHEMFSTSLQHLLHPIPTVHPYLYHHYSSLISLYSKQHFWELLWEVQNKRISQHNPSDEQKDQEPLAAVDYQPPSKVFKAKTAPGITLTHSSVSNKSLPDHNMNLISKQSNSCKTGVNDAMQEPTSLRIQNNEIANNKESGCQTQDYPIDLSFRVNTAKAQQELA